MQRRQVVDKRTADDRIVTVDCRGVLAADETIAGVTTIADDGAVLTIGTPTINVAAIPLTDELGAVYDTIPIGQAFAVEVSAGEIPAGAQFLTCVVRALLATSINTAVEATFGIRLIDNPIF